MSEQGETALEYATRVLDKMERDKPRLRVMDTIASAMIVINAASIVAGVILLLWRLL